MYFLQSVEDSNKSWKFAHQPWFVFRQNCQENAKRKMLLVTTNSFNDFMRCQFTSLDVGWFCNDVEQNLVAKSEAGFPTPSQSLFQDISKEKYHAIYNATSEKIAKAPLQKSPLITEKLLPNEVLRQWKKYHEKEDPLAFLNPEVKLKLLKIMNL